MQRLKDARAEAEAEIEQLREERRQHFAAHEQSLIAGLNKHILEQNQTTEQELAHVAQQAAQHRAAVLAMLVDKVLDVKPSLHPNARPAQQ